MTLTPTISEFTPFDWVTAVAVGAIVGRTATAADTSWLTGTSALLTFSPMPSPAFPYGRLQRPDVYVASRR
ncbi:hypothetical protein AWC06_12200 [Mycobacterium fragae]|uniref:Uncharacterized protein n=1 Tax=Mycobacterium fragae TaxID=1260918 RepID=A0A1X1UWT0_9MYCO|nr:hypothetical protein AWC06_12200 [Mycobacterium fragae]